MIGIEAAAEAVAGIGEETPAWREEELRGWLAQRLDALRLANAIIYGWGGIPVLWSGDELGQLNDPNWDTSDWRAIPAWRLAEYGVLGAVDVLTDTVPAGAASLEGGGDGMVAVPPFAAWWLVRSTD